MCPGGASFTPGAGSPLGRRGEGTGLRSNLFPCAQGPRIPAPRLGAGPALPSSPPTSGHLQGSTVGDADRAPIAPHTPHPHQTAKDNSNETSVKVREAYADGFLAGALPQSISTHGCFLWGSPSHE